MIICLVTGIIGRNAEAKPIGDQIVINFTLASNKNIKDREGNKVQKTTWLDCSMWVRSDSLSQYLTSGKMIQVTGEPSAECYVNTNGVSVPKLKFRVNSLEFIN